VPAGDHDQALATLAHEHRRVLALGVPVKRLAAADARDESERTYRQLQREARRTLVTLAAEPLIPAEPAEPLRVATWACRTCGRIEAPQPCVGICVKNRTEMFAAADHDEILAAAADAHRRAEQLGALVRKLAWATPHRDQYARSHRALRTEAHKLLSA
jgi:hypothetical protein